jgi:hypothetical protein
MALVENLTEGFKNRHSIHKKTESTYFLVFDNKGTKYLQIDTYGSDDREMPGKVSQSLQFSPKAIEQLRKILEQKF